MLSDMDGNNLSEAFKKISFENGATRIEKNGKQTGNNLQGGQNLTVLYPTTIPNASTSECDSINSGVTRRIPCLKRKGKRKPKRGKRPPEETFDGFWADDEEDYEHRWLSCKSANCTTPSFSQQSGISDGLESPFDSGNDDVFSSSCPVNLDMLDYHYFCKKHQRNEVPRRARRQNILSRRRYFSEAELVPFGYVDYQMQAYKEEQYLRPRRAQSDDVRLKKLRDAGSGASISESRCLSIEMMSQITSGIHSGFSFAPYVDSPSAFLQYNHRRKATPEPFYSALPSSGSRLFPMTLDARPPRDVEGPSALRNSRSQYFPRNVAADVDYDCQEPNLSSGNVFYGVAPTDFEKMHWECEDQQVRRPSWMGISRKKLERKRSSSAPEVLYAPRDGIHRQQRNHSIGCISDFELGSPTNLIHPLTKDSLLSLHRDLTDDDNDTSLNRTTQRRASVIFPLTEEYLTIHDDMMNRFEQDEVYSDLNSNHAQSFQHLGHLCADHAKYSEYTTPEGVFHATTDMFGASVTPVMVISPPQPIFTDPYNEEPGRYNRSYGGQNDEICIEMESSHPHSDARTIPELTVSGLPSKENHGQGRQREHNLHVKLARCIAGLVLVTVVITCVIIWTS